jgi:hypothetical protein
MPTRPVDKRLEQRRVLRLICVPQHADCEPARGRTIHAADALVVGTARAHRTILLTDSVRDFPMGDLRASSTVSVSDTPNFDRNGR